MMKKLTVLAAIIILAGCSTTGNKQAGMANPASVYCGEIGGKLEIVNTDKGQVGYCTLPSGERVEEWTLYRRDHK